MKSFVTWSMVTMAAVGLSCRIAVSAPSDATASVKAAAEPPIVYDARVTPLAHGYQGPFVNMPDGSILGIEANTVIRSNDKGATWTVSELFSDAQKAKLKLTVSRERALVRTKDGTLFMGCMNLAELNWTWDPKIHDGPGSTLPTYVMRSTDDGKTWTDLQKLHDDWTGEVRDLIQTKSGRLMSHPQ